MVSAKHIHGQPIRPQQQLIFELRSALPSRPSASGCAIRTRGSTPIVGDHRSARAGVSAMYIKALADGSATSVPAEHLEAIE